MTSSLVGSEMCIRDRCSDRRELQGHSHFRRDTEKPCPQGPIPTGRSRPVSYTHLTLPTICSV
eukprot:792642-Prorocentrum_lima.AAC.1